MSELEPRRQQPEKIMKRQCVRIMKSGERCRKAPILGGTVCSKHGGRAGHIKAAAKARLENAADRLARQLLGMAEDPKMPPAVKLAALKDALDRAGLSPRQALDVSAELKPFEQFLQGAFDGIDRNIPPSDLSDRPDWAHPDDDRFGDAPDIVEAEVVDPYEDNAPDPDTGRVHCTECGAPFPAELPPSLTKFPTVCGDCRAAARAERATDRELDETVGARGGTRPPIDPMTARRGRQPAEPKPEPDRTPGGRNPRYPKLPRRYG